MVRHTLPLGMSETFTYDASGNRATRTNFKGELTEYEYDDHNRLIRVYHEGMLEQEMTYTQDGQRETVTDSRGTTTYEYDPHRRRLTKVIHPDLSEVSYTYDANGNRLTVGGVSPILTIMRRLSQRG